MSGPYVCEGSKDDIGWENTLGCGGMSDPSDRPRLSTPSHLSGTASVRRKLLTSPSSPSARLILFFVSLHWCRQYFRSIMVQQVPYYIIHDVVHTIIFMYTSRGS
jgi:hypothetical protein